MPQQKATGIIRIVKVPSGEAPLEIREAWVGLELPCDPVLGLADIGHRIGAVSGKRLPNQYGFSVPQKEALDILEQSKPAVAAWWRSRGCPRTDRYNCFSFEESCAVVVSGVTRQTLVEVRDEDRGDPYR